MKDLVFIRDQSVQAEPYTTSQIIAECAEVQHHTITRLLRTHKKDFEAFGVIGFEIHKIGGRGRPDKTYHLNEQQATLLITYLQNTAPVRAFKKELVRQFFLMREELTKRRVSRQLMKPTRRSMTDAIRDNTPPEHLNRFTYSNYTDLAYRAAPGLSVKQIKQARAIPEGKALVDYMSATELEAVKRVEAVITALLDAGAGYQGIKAALLQSGVQRISA